MNELIEIHYENDKPTVNGRDLHRNLVLKLGKRTVLKNMIRAGSKMHKRVLLSFE